MDMKFDSGWQPDYGGMFLKKWLIFSFDVNYKTPSSG